MSDSERDLVTSEGVDEGSAPSGTEDSGNQPGQDTLGPPASGAPENAEQQAAPVPVGSGEPAGPGQRNEVGEG